MQVHFIKQSHQQYRLECRRADGSTTTATLEARSYFKHDLMHFIVEHTARLQQSFFGTVQAGKDLSELSPQAMKSGAVKLPPEIDTTEIIVAALQDIASKPAADFVAAHRAISTYLTQVTMPTPSYFTPDFCQRTVDELRVLLARWERLRTGEQFEFLF